MTVRGWKAKIRRACREAGTYQPYFEAVIASLAETLAQLDEVRAQYEEEGSEPVVEQTNRAGHTSTVKNPLLVLIMDLRSAALGYYKELGLTPGGRTKLGLPPYPTSGSGKAKDPMFGD